MLSTVQDPSLAAKSLDNPKLGSCLSSGEGRLSDVLTKEKVMARFPIIGFRPQLSASQRSAGKKILCFLQFLIRTKRAYETQFGAILEQSARRIQHTYRCRKLRQRAKHHGIFKATVYLETRDLNLGQVLSVEIFGEFS